MKIVFVHLTAGLVNRGSEVVTDLVAEKLSKHHEVVMIQGGKKTKRPYTIISIPVNAEKLPVAPKTLLDKYRFRHYEDAMSKATITFTKKAIPYLIELDPDIIVAVNGWPQLKYLKSQKIRAKIVVFGHAGIGYHDDDSIRAQPDLFVALSHNADTWAQTIATKNTKIVHIPNPVNLSIYRSARPAKRFFAGPTILTVGALSEYKNIDLVIRAVAKTNYSLLIIGEGEEEESLKKLAKKLLPPERVIFLHKIEPKDMAAIYRSTDVFCFIPDKQEAFGRVYLEAMCCNLPIVASDDPIRHDIVGEAGFYAHPTNLRAVVKALHAAVKRGPVSYRKKLRAYETGRVCRQIEETFRLLLPVPKEKLRIAILHMTLGLVDRGSEISTDIIAEELAKTEEVLVLRAGTHMGGNYPVRQIYTLKTEPPVAPRNLVEKLLFRLYLDRASQAVRAFTEAALPHLALWKPDIIIATNGALQLKVIKELETLPKLVVFGRAGIGYHDLDNLHEHPDLFIALSPSAATWAEGHRSANTHVVMIPNPLETNSYASVKPVELNIPHPRVMTVGALSSYKNIDKVVEAVKEADASLLLVGDGEERDHISSLLSDMKNDFRWIRHLNPSELPGYYVAADVFCFIPDPQEALGRVYLEAMAAGLPIVASDDPIRRKLIGKQGIYVHPHDSSAVIKGIVRALTMGKVDYTKQLAPYNVETVIKELRKEFHALIK